MGCKRNQSENRESTYINSLALSRQTDELYLADHITINTVTTLNIRGPTDYNLENSENNMLKSIEQPRL